MSFQKRVLLGATAFASLFGSNALAQTAPDAGGAVSDEVIVTAQRRAENLQDVPLSVTAVSAATLEERNIVDISRLDVVTPGFTYGRSGIDSRPAMRGVRTENIGVNGDTTIGYFIDGIYQSRAAQASAAFVDVARVEVQRGPQGTLYGRNTFGGNISVITNTAAVGESDFGATAQYGSFNSSKVDGFVNIPLGGAAALRFAGAYADGDGYVENDFNAGADLFDTDIQYLRAAFALKPNSSFELNLRADRLEQGGNGGSAFGYKIVGAYHDLASGQSVFNSTPLFLNTRPNNRDGIDDNPLIAGVQDLGVPIHSANDPFKIDNDYKSFLDLTRTSFTGDAAWDLGPVTLKAITGYVDFEVERTQDTDFSRNTLGIDYQLTSSETFSQELQLVSNGDGPLQYVLGVYYFQDDLRGVFINQQLAPVVGGVSVNGGVPFGGSFYDDQIAGTESTAYYAQGTYALTDRLNATVGVRSTSDDKTFQVNRPAVQSAANVIGVLLANPVPFDFDPGAGVVTQIGKTFDKTTYRVGVDFQVTDTNLLYGSVSSGFRSGGFNTNTAVQAQTFEPEEVTAYEIGSKNRFFDDTLTLNVAAFFNDYTNLQEQRQVPVGATTASIVFNAASAEAYGLEAEAVFTPTSAFTFGGTLSILNAEYTDFNDAPIPGGYANPITGPGTINTALLPLGLTCRIVPGSVTGGTPNGVLGCDLSGKKIPFSPEYSGTIYASYEFGLGGLGTLTPFAAVTYSAEYFGQVFNTQLERTDAFARVDLSLQWEPKENVSLRAFVDNATDETILNRAVYGGGGAIQGSFQPPRTWGVRVGIKR